MILIMRPGLLEWAAAVHFRCVLRQNPRVFAMSGWRNLCGRRVLFARRVVQEPQERGPERCWAGVERATQGKYTSV